MQGLIKLMGALIQYDRAVFADIPKAGTVRVENTAQMVRKDTLQMAQAATTVGTKTTARMV